MPVSRNQQDVRLCHKRGILPSTRSSLRGDYRGERMMGKDKRNKWKNIRFTEKELESLKKKFQNSTSSQLSHYMREILLGRPIVIKYRNESLDSFMEELIAMKQELNAIGNNLNQAVKKLHTLKTIPEFRQWIANYKSIQDQVKNRTQQIESKISKISEVWLQG